MLRIQDSNWTALEILSSGLNQGAKSLDMDECDVRGMMATTLRVLRLFGLAPLRFSRVDSGVYLASTSRTIFIIGIICILGIQSLIFLIFYFYIMEYIQKFVAYHYFSLTYIILLFLNIAWTSLLLTVAIVGGLTRMKSLFILLKQILEVQTKLEYSTSLEPKIYTVLTILLLPVFINCFIYELNIFLLIDYSNIEAITVLVYTSNVFMILTTFVILLELQYIFLGQSLYLVVKTINCQMSQIIEQSIGTDITDELIHKKLLSLFQCYLEMCGTINQMNQSEGLMMVSLFFREITYTFITTHHLSILFLSASSLKQNVRILSNSIILLFTISRIMVFTEMGFRLHCEITKHKTLLTEMMWRQSNNVTLQRTLNNYMYQFLLKQPDLSPLGIITFSRPLIATIAGVNISFIIIVLQFKLEYP